MIEELSDEEDGMIVEEPEENEDMDQDEGKEDEEEDLVLIPDASTDATGGWGKISRKTSSLLLLKIGENSKYLYFN